MAPQSLPKLSLVAFILALLVYWLVWSGLPHAVDELSALSVAESMRAGDGFVVNQMEWDQARTPPQNAWGASENLYSKKGIGVSLAAFPLAWIGATWQMGGSVRQALLTGSILAALAVAVLVWAAQRIGYDQRTSILGGAIFAFGTLLFPYARTFFSEAIAAPALMLALGAILVWRVGRAQSALLLVLAGCGLAGVILAKSSNAVNLPFFFLYAMWVAWRATLARKGRLLAALVALFSLAVPVGVAIAMTFGYNYIRFGTFAGFPLEPFETFSTPLLVGLAGLLVSPGKGIVWYMPVTLVAAAGLLIALLKPRRFGINRADTLLLLGTILAPLVLYALWYDWPGGRAWGPRMIAWLSPAIVLLALPVLDALWGSGRAKSSALRRFARWGVGLLLALSFAFNALGALLNFEAMEATQMNAGATFDSLLWQVSYSPLVTYWREIRLATIEPILLQGSTWANAPFGTLLAIVLGAIAGWLVFRFWRRRNVGGLWIALAAALIAGLVLSSASSGDPRWQDDSANPEDNAALVEWLDEYALPEDLLIFDLEDGRAVQSRAWWRQNALPAGNTFLGWLRKEEPWAGLNTPEESLLFRQAVDHPRTLLVLQETPEGDPASTTEDFLSRYLVEGESTWIGAQRIVAYYRTGVGEEFLGGGGNLIFDGDAGGADEWSIASAETPDAWLVFLGWNRGTSSELRFSVQGLDASGNVTGQIDRAPTGENYRVALHAPEAVRVILKMYDPVTGDVQPIGGQEAFTLWQE